MHVSKPKAASSNSASSLAESRAAQDRREAARDLQAEVSALRRAHAVIEFSLDGRILDANENFLATVGYTMDEIRGQHHGMFVDPVYRQSMEYRMFWDKLGRGEYDSGQYKRIVKGGAEIWLQASYNPITDLAGTPSKVVKYATDITAQKLQAADFVGQIAAMGKAQAVIAFAMDGRILEANENFLDCGQLHVSTKFVASTIVCLSIRHIGKALNTVCSGTNWGAENTIAGQYKRIAKGGREIWLQASYNPDHGPGRQAVQGSQISQPKSRRRSCRPLLTFEGQLAAINKAQAVIEFSLDGKRTACQRKFPRPRSVTPWTRSAASITACSLIRPIVPDG